MGGRPRDDGNSRGERVLSPMLFQGAVALFALPVSTRPSISRLTLRLIGFVRGRLWLQVLVAMFAGITIGMAIGPTGGWLSPARRCTR